MKKNIIILSGIILVIFMIALVLVTKIKPGKMTSGKPAQNTLSTSKIKGKIHIVTSIITKISTNNNMVQTNTLTNIITNNTSQEPYSESVSVRGNNRNPIDVFGEVSLFIGDCSFSRDNGTNWQPAEIGMALSNTDLVRTAAKSELEISLPNNDTIRLAPSTRIDLMQVHAENQKIKPSKIKLWLGKIFFTGKPDQSNFEIETESAVAAVRGTEFTAEQSNNKETRIAVFEGKVAVSAKGKEVTVPPNYGTIVRYGFPPEDPFALPSPPDQVKIRAH